jgi:hypothetical protein
MSRDLRLAILSDVHYACAAEQTAGDDYEVRAISNPLLRLVLGLYRHHVWLRYPLRQNGQLDRFLAELGPVDFVIANGDYCCNVAAVGVSDAAAMQSARECLDKLRGKLGERLLANFGDHELGKLRLMGTRGGLRLDSWRRAITELGLPSPSLSWNGPGELHTARRAGFWRLQLGNYVLLNAVSTLVALPAFENDLLPEERSGWVDLREQHLAEVRAGFAALEPWQRVLLFCHDPMALPFLWREEAVRSRLPQIEQTIIGHLHSNLILRLSRLLAGMPAIGFLGGSIRKLSTALNQARVWRHFRVRLCPSLAGIELLKDGGYLTAELDAEARRPVQFQFHPLPR